MYKIFPKIFVSTLQLLLMEILSLLVNSTTIITADRILENSVDNAAPATPICAP